MVLNKFTAKNPFEENHFPSCIREYNFKKKDKDKIFYLQPRLDKDHFLFNL